MTTAPLTARASAQVQPGQSIDADNFTDALAAGLPAVALCGIIGLFLGNVAVGLIVGLAFPVLFALAAICGEFDRYFFLKAHLAATAFPKPPDRRT